jgi:hypothetical protein
MRHLDERPEAVGFFIAEYDAAARAFDLRAWWPVLEGGYEYQGDYHVRLSDDTQTKAIQWATRERGCLVEAHSHGLLTPAAFSPTDLDGLAAWVPHCSWRLQRRPYAAIVTAEDGFDGLAWIDSVERAEQVTALIVGGEEMAATGVTLHRTGERP